MAQAVRGDVMNYLPWIMGALGFFFCIGLGVLAVWVIDREDHGPYLTARDTATVELFHEMNRHKVRHYGRPIPANAPSAAVMPDVTADEPEWAHLARTWTDNTGSFMALTNLGDDK